MNEERRFDAFGFEAVIGNYPEAEDEAWAGSGPSNEEFAGEDFDFAETEGELLVERVSNAEGEAAGQSSAEWLEAEWLDTSHETPTGETVAAFCQRVGREWAERSNGKLTAEGKRDALLADHADHQTGASLRRRNQGKAVTEEFLGRVTRAWMIGREEEMRFQTEGGKGIAPLGPFAAPATPEPTIDHALVGGTLDAVRRGKRIPGAKIAPLTLRFAQALRSRHPTVGMTNYHGHGGAGFTNRGHSLDLWLSATDSRGFYRHDEAVRLLRAVNAAARAVGAQWRVIYNDFAVADAINREMKRRHVIFVGAVRRNKAKRVTGLNWHGPDPLILHFHLDIAPLTSGGGQGEAHFEHEASPGTACNCVKCKRFGPASYEMETEDEWIGEDEWAGEEFADESEEEISRYDPPDEENAFETSWGEGEDSEQQGEHEQEGGAIATAGLSVAERKALDITSTLETGKRGGFFGLSGNFDGQGLSFGLVNWTIGTGSLQPLLREFARNRPDRWAAAFGPDADRFLKVIMPTGKAARAAQLRFAVEEMNGTEVVRGRRRWFIRQPWREYFVRLAADPAFQAIQVSNVRTLLDRAAYFCRLFGLKSEMAYAFMFDAVSSHGKWWLTKKFRGAEKRRNLIEQRRRERGGQLSESDLLLLFADVLGETSAPRWAEKVRARKRWFVTGEHPRARELSGLRPRPDVDFTVSRPAPVGEQEHDEAEDLAWLAFERGEEAIQFEEEEGWGREHEGSLESGEDFSDEGWQGEAENSFEQESEQLYWSNETYEDAEWQPSQEFEEALLAAVDEAGLAGEIEREVGCGPKFPEHCKGYDPDYEKRIIRRGTADGDVMDRTEGDRRERLALQFRDYDVNAYMPATKKAHAFDLPKIIEFIERRVAEGADVQVSVSGSASHTGTKCFNQHLSEKRAQCMAEFIKSLLSSRALARTKIDSEGRGFSEAVEKKASGELPGYRSVLVSVSGPDKPKPIPPEPSGWDKYCIRVCSYKSQSLGEVAIDELLKKLPNSVPPGVARSIVGKLRERLQKMLARLLKKMPKLGSLIADLSMLLRFLPIEISRQRVVLQVKERDRQNPRMLTLCYLGFGGRLALGIPGDIDDALDELLQKVPVLGSNKTLRDRLRVLIKRELDDLLPKRLTKLMAKLDSDVPGPWKAFDISRREPIEVFRGSANVFIDVVSNVMDPGSIFVAFDGNAWNKPGNKLEMRCAKGCAGPVIQLQVDGGVGFDLLSVNAGEIKSTGCVCVPEAAGEALAELEWA